jgi:hypothetical protein
VVKTTIGYYYGITGILDEPHLNVTWWGLVGWSNCPTLCLRFLTNSAKPICTTCTAQTNSSGFKPEPVPCEYTLLTNQHRA